MKYHVTYASAGCLPDSEPMRFDTLEQAAVYVVSEHDEIGWTEEQAGGDEVPPLTIAQVMVDLTAPDPRDGSLYAWTIEQVESRMTDAQYVECGGNKCPYCQSENIESDKIEVDDFGATQDVACLDCGKKWYDTYRLTGYMDPEG